MRKEARAPRLVFANFEDTRYIDIREDDQLDEAQLVDWVKQASQLPGERMWAAGAGRVRGVSGRQVISPQAHDQVLTSDTTVTGERQQP